MTAAGSTRARPSWSWSSLGDDARQLIAVVVMVCVAVGAGLAVKVFAEGQTRSVQANGVTAAIPQGWVLAQGAGDLAFTVSDPRSPGHKYSVGRLTTPGLTPAQAADTQTAAKSRILERFAILDRETVTVGGRSTQRVHYVYVTDGPGGIPQVIEGNDDYVAGTGSVLVISLTASTRDFDNALPAFERFAASVNG